MTAWDRAAWNRAVRGRIGWGRVVRALPNPPGRFRARRTYPLPGPADLVKVALRGGWALRDLRDAALIPVRPGPLPELGPGETSVTWVGHATTLIRTGGANLLVDPLWSDKIFGARPRLTPPGLPFGELPPIDAVLISHDHSDHLDRPTLRRLPRTTPILTPLGVGAWFRRAGFRTVTELDWWGRAPAGAATVTLVPAHHWSGRGPLGLYASLWGGWVVDAPSGHRVYHAGDTAYGPCFAEIGRRLPGIDLAIMPTGSHAPRWFQRSAHIDPQDAVRACADLGAARLLPVHWGTLVLGTEPLLAPLHETIDAWRHAGLPAGALWDLAIGETRVLPPVRSPGEPGERVTAAGAVASLSPPRPSPGSG